MTDLNNMLPFCEDINNMIIEQSKPEKFDNIHNMYWSDNCNCIEFFILKRTKKSLKALSSSYFIFNNVTWFITEATNTYTGNLEDSICIHYKDSNDVVCGFRSWLSDMFIYLEKDKNIIHCYDFENVEPFYLSIKTNKSGDEYIPHGRKKENRQLPKNMINLKEFMKSDNIEIISIPEQIKGMFD